MIPEFNKYGNLPDGIYKVTLEEIKERFGANTLQRKELFKKLKSLINLLSKDKSRIKRLIINGSFVTDIECPKDIDCIIIFNINFTSRDLLLKKISKLKMLHIFDYTEYKDSSEYNAMIKFWGHTREKRLKGIMEVEL